MSANEGHGAFWAPWSDRQIIDAIRTERGEAANSEGGRLESLPSLSPTGP